METITDRTDEELKFELQARGYLVTLDAPFRAAIIEALEMGDEAAAFVEFESEFSRAITQLVHWRNRRLGIPHA